MKNQLIENIKILLILQNFYKEIGSFQCIKDFKQNYSVKHNKYIYKANLLKFKNIRIIVSL